MSPSSSNKSRFALYGWLVSSLAALFYTYEYLLRIEPSVMVPQLMEHFTITAGGIGLLQAMYYYAYTPMQAVVGVTTDYFGPKRVLVVAIALCAVGSFIFAGANTIYWASAGRLLIGVGSAFAFVGVLKLAAMWLPANRFALFAGIATSLGMLGALVGDVEMSRVVHGYGWHKVIILSAWAGVILLPIFITLVRERKVDQVTDQKTSFAGFARQFLSVIKNHQLILAGLVGCMLFLSLTVVAEMWGIPFLRAMTHTSKVSAAKLNSMIFLGWLFGAPFYGWLSDRIKARRILLIAGSILAALTFSILLIWPNLHTIIIVWILFFFGFFSSVEILVFAIGRDLTSVHLVATAMGLINMLIMLGGMVVQPIAAKTLDLAWQGGVHAGVRVYGVNDYRIALMIVPVGLLIGAVMAYFLKETWGANHE